MKVSTPPILTLLVFNSLVSAGAINRLWMREQPAPPAPQQPAGQPATPPDKFNGETQELQAQGLCRLYTDQNKAKTSSMDLCSANCNPNHSPNQPGAPAPAATDFTVNITCTPSEMIPGDKAPKPDPENVMYTTGVCSCEVPAVEYLKNIFDGLQLPQIAKSICEPWFKEVSTIFDAETKKMTQKGPSTDKLPEIGGNTTVALRIAVQGANTLQAKGGSPTDFADYYKEACAEKATPEAVAMAEKAYESLIIVDDKLEVAKVLPCKDGKPECWNYDRCKAK
ncbi:hypothetical protein GLAREA_11595 [Glarea lozoyensis ATCC 20868]|uniref:Uncharacterized protein n=1 Tax=Glarea lozoyensis (strain ATCC 20868 / MF5171) TaxID=1116229 RepID=S3CIC2_GLAL2|nr:uncharacterized protein GLAREA_11595 [Glarea lozoyensis ATCC 20868]EPE25014.1 hypothetical protein GLAREA_11595 [Glarea lozoyensis ATCC 20868]